MLYLFILFLCYVPIVIQIFGRIEGLDIRSVWLVFCVVILAFCGYILKKMKFFRFINTWFFIACTYALVLFASISWSTYSYDVPTVKLFITTAVAPLLIAAMAMTLLDQEPRLHIYVKHLMIAASALSLIALYQFQYHVNVVTITGSARAAATLGNPNALAVFLVLAIPCILYGIDAKLLPKLIAWPIFATVIGGVLSTVSRKGIITMAFSVLLYYVLKKDFKKLLVIIIVFILLGLKLVGGRVATRFTEEQFAHEQAGRGAVISAGLETFRKNPLIGIGYCGFFENYGVYFPHASEKKYDAHNMYITVLADSGLLGFLPFISIFLYPLFVSFKVLRRRNEASGSTYSKSVATISICSVLSFMIMGFAAGGIFNMTFVVALFYVNASLTFGVRELDGKHRSSVRHNSGSVKSRCPRVSVPE